MCLGVPGQIVEVVGEATRLAMADFGGVRRRVDLTCVLDDGQQAQDLIGAWVLVHVGFAMSVIGERQALETLELLAELGEFQDEMEVMAATADRPERPRRVDPA
jgi:hydrogenase expression/formation protein HypC